MCKLADYSVNQQITHVNWQFTLVKYLIPGFSFILICTFHKTLLHWELVSSFEAPPLLNGNFWIHQIFKRTTENKFVCSFVANESTALYLLF